MSLLAILTAGILPGIVDVSPIAGSQPVICNEYWFFDELDVQGDAACLSTPMVEVDAYASAYTGLLINSGWRFNSGGGNQFWFCKPGGIGLTMAAFPAEKPASDDWTTASEKAILFFFSTSRSCFDDNAI